MCSSLTFSKLLGDHWVIFVNSLLCPSAKEIGAQRLFRVLPRLGTAEVSLASGSPVLQYFYQVLLLQLHLALTEVPCRQHLPIWYKSGLNH